MKSIKILFTRTKTRKPHLNDLTILSIVVEGQNLTRKTLSENLTNLVNKNEYFPSEKSSILDELEYWTQLGPEYKNRPWTAIVHKAKWLSENTKTKLPTKSQLQIVQNGIFDDYEINSAINNNK